MEVSFGKLSISAEAKEIEKSVIDDKTTTLINGEGMNVWNLFNYK